MQVKLFTKTDCPRCPAAKHAVQDISEVEMYDLDQVDGLAEAAFYGVMSTPTVIILDDAGREVAAWRGTAPTKNEVAAALAD
mgnify:CR=1 FL=1